MVGHTASTAHYESSMTSLSSRYPYVSLWSCYLTIPSEYKNTSKSWQVNRTLRNKRHYKTLMILRLLPIKLSTIILVLCSENRMEQMSSCLLGVCWWMASSWLWKLSLIRLQMLPTYKWRGRIKLFWRTLIMPLIWLLTYEVNFKESTFYFCFVITL